MSEVRLIDADALMETIREDKIEESVMQIMDALGNKWEAETVNLTCERHIKMIDDAPTISPKTGRWIAHDSSIKDVPTEACSECGMWSYGWKMPYCPNCGCRMEEVTE